MLALVIFAMLAMWTTNIGVKSPILRRWPKSVSTSAEKCDAMIQKPLSLSCAHTLSPEKSHSCLSTSLNSRTQITKTSHLSAAALSEVPPAGRSAITPLIPKHLSSRRLENPPRPLRCRLSTSIHVPLLKSVSNIKQNSLSLPSRFSDI